MKLNTGAYELALAVFREDLHPRDPSGRFRKVLDRVLSNRDRLLKEARSKGEAPDKGEAGRLQHYVDTGKVAIRTTQTALYHVLNDKRFKTFHESGTTLGEPDPRKLEWEKDIWGDHPIYGYVAPGDEAGRAPYDAGVGMYGPVKVELRDDVKARATVTPNDSWMAGGYPSPATNIDPLTTADAPSEWEDGWKEGRAYGELHGPYVEAQIFGGVKSDDIERVIFGAGPPSPELREQLEEHGIQWMLDPDWEEHRAEFEAEYWEPEEIDTDRYR
jgi:hypothetical protein